MSGVTGTTITFFADFFLGFTSLYNSERDIKTLAIKMSMRYWLLNLMSSKKFHWPDFFYLLHATNEKAVNNNENEK